MRLAQEAAEFGLGSAWFGQTFGADSPQLAALAGRAVPGLQVGTSAIPALGRHPLLVSSQAQTAQAATHGRYHLGPAIGTKLLTATTPVPARVPGAENGVPVLVAAMRPQALRVSGRASGRYLALSGGAAALADHIVPTLTAAAEAAGRPAPRVVALVPGVVTDDVDAVREKATDNLAFHEQIPSYARVIELSGGRQAADLQPRSCSRAPRSRETPTADALGACSANWPAEYAGRPGRGATGEACPGGDQARS